MTLNFVDLVHDSPVLKCDIVSANKVLYDNNAACSFSIRAPCSIPSCFHS